MIKTYYNEVLYVLANDAESRNCDRRLTCVLWNYTNPSKTLKTPQGDAVLMKDIIYALPHSDSIERARRVIQNDLGLYPPTTWKIAKKRRMAEDIWQEERRHKITLPEAQKMLNIYLKKTK